MHVRADNRLQFLADVEVDLITTVSQPSFPPRNGARERRNIPLSGGRQSCHPGRGQDLLEQRRWKNDVPKLVG